MEDNVQKKELLSLTEAAAYCHITRQAVYVAMRHGKIKATKVKNKWFFTKTDIDEYRANKYNRDLMKKNGEYVFDTEKGEFSAGQVCRVFSEMFRRPFPLQRMYYLLRTGQLKASRKGNSWVIMKHDAIEFFENQTKAKEDPNQMSMV